MHGSYDKNVPDIRVMLLVAPESRIQEFWYELEVDNDDKADKIWFVSGFAREVDPMADPQEAEEDGRLCICFWRFLIC